MRDRTYILSDPDPNALSAFVHDTTVAAFPLVTVLQGVVGNGHQRRQWQLTAYVEGKHFTAVAALHRIEGYCLLHTVVPEHGLRLISSLMRKRTIRVIAGELESVAPLFEAPPVAPRIRRVEREHFMVLRAFSHQVEPDGNYRPALREEIPTLRAYAAGYSAEHDVPFSIDWEYEVARGQVMVADVLPPHPQGQIAACLMRGGTVEPFTLASAVYTFPPFRGQGYAQRLLANFCLEAALAGLDTCLYVGVDNRPALTAYERVGFFRAGDYAILYLRSNI